MFSVEEVGDDVYECVADRQNSGRAAEGAVDSVNSVQFSSVPCPMESFGDVRDDFFLLQSSSLVFPAGEDRELVLAWIGTYPR